MIIALENVSRLEVCKISAAIKTKINCLHLFHCHIYQTPQAVNLSQHNFYTKKSDFYCLKGSLFRFLPETERIIIDDFGEDGTKIRRKLKTWSPLKKPYLDFWYHCKTLKVFFIHGGIFAAYNIKT